MSKGRLITEFFQRRSPETIQVLLVSDIVSAVEKRLRKHDLEYDSSVRGGGEVELTYRGHGLKVTTVLNIRVERTDGQDGQLGSDSVTARHTADGLPVPSTAGNQED